MSGTNYTSTKTVRLPNYRDQQRISLEFANRLQEKRLRSLQESTFCVKDNGKDIHKISMKKTHPSLHSINDLNDIKARLHDRFKDNILGSVLTNPRSAAQSVFGSFLSRIKLEHQLLKGDRELLGSEFVERGYPIKIKSLSTVGEHTPMINSDWSWFADKANDKGVSLLGCVADGMTCDEAIYYTYSSQRMAYLACKAAEHQAMKLSAREPMSRASKELALSIANEIESNAITKMCDSEFLEQNGGNMKAVATTFTFLLRVEDKLYSVSKGDPLSFAIDKKGNLIESSVNEAQAIDNAITSYIGMHKDSGNNDEWLPSNTEWSIREFDLNKVGAVFLTSDGAAPRKFDNNLSFAKSLKNHAYRDLSDDASLAARVRAIVKSAKKGGSDDDITVTAFEFGKNESANKSIKDTLFDFFNQLYS